MEAADSECWATNPEFLRILLEVACRHEVHLDGPIPRNQKWEAISAELKAIPQFADQALQLDGKVLRRKCNELKQQFESKHKDSIFSTTEHSTLAPQPADLVTSKHETIFLQMFEERKQQLQAAEKTKNQQKQETPPKFKETSTTESPNENDWNAAALISFFNIARKEKVHIAHGKKSRSAEEKWQQVRKQFAFALPAHSPLEHASETALQNKLTACCNAVNSKYSPTKGKQPPSDAPEQDKIIFCMLREGDADVLNLTVAQQEPLQPDDAAVSAAPAPVLWDREALQQLLTLARDTKVHFNQRRKGSSFEKKWSTVRTLFAAGLPANSPLKQLTADDLLSKFDKCCLKVCRKYRPAVDHPAPEDASDLEKLVCEIVLESNYAYLQAMLNQDDDDDNGSASDESSSEQSTDDDEEQTTANKRIQWDNPTVVVPFLEIARKHRVHIHHERMMVDEKWEHVAEEFFALPEMVQHKIMTAGSLRAEYRVLWAKTMHHCAPEVGGAIPDTIGAIDRVLWEMIVEASTLNKNSKQQRKRHLTSSKYPPLLQPPTASAALQTKHLPHLQFTDDDVQLEFLRIARKHGAHIADGQKSGGLLQFLKWEAAGNEFYALAAYRQYYRTSPRTLKCYYHTWCKDINMKYAPALGKPIPEDASEVERLLCTMMVEGSKHRPAAPTRSIQTRSRHTHGDADGTKDDDSSSLADLIADYLQQDSPSGEQTLAVGAASAGDEEACWTMDSQEEAEAEDETEDEDEEEEELCAMLASNESASTEGSDIGDTSSSNSTTAEQQDEREAKRARIEGEPPTDHKLPSAASSSETLEGLST